MVAYTCITTLWPQCDSIIFARHLLMCHISSNRTCSIYFFVSTWVFLHHSASIRLLYSFILFRMCLLVSHVWNRSSLISYKGSEHSSLSYRYAESFVPILTLFCIRYYMYITIILYAQSHICGDNIMLLTHFSYLNNFTYPTPHARGSGQRWLDNRASTVAVL